MPLLAAACSELPGSQRQISGGFCRSFALRLRPSCFICFFSFSFFLSRFINQTDHAVVRNAGTTLKCANPEVCKMRRIIPYFDQSYGHKAACLVSFIFGTLNEDQRNDEARRILGSWVTARARYCCPASSSTVRRFAGVTVPIGHGERDR